MRPLLAFLALILVAIGVAAFTTHLRPAPDRPPAEVGAEEEAKKAEEAQQKMEAAKKNHTDSAFDAVKEGAIHVVMEVENRGSITLELYPKAAPKTVDHFVTLVKKHFYDGILFHRVHPAFVAQAGDPNSKKVDGSKLVGLTDNEVSEQFHLGGGGSGQSVPLEANLPHLANTLGLARSNAPDSGDSQFFINLADNPSLDSNYCVFGRVIAGQDVAGKIVQGDRIKSMNVQ